MHKILKRSGIIVLVLAVIFCSMTFGVNNTKVSAATVVYKNFLKADGTELKNEYGEGDTVYLRGVNAGGYMLQEIWMCPTKETDNVTCQMDIINILTDRFGSAGAQTLISTYEENYWTESDFDNCVELGINCIRLPVWYRNFVDENGDWYDNAFERVDWFVEQAGERGIYVILDMHGAYGSQNGSIHSGVDGGDDKVTASEFFFGDSAASNQEAFYDIWEKIAGHYKGNPVIAGYDVLNEPYSEYRYTSGYSDDYLRTLLWGIYDKAYDRIRSVDPDHVIIMEATWEPEDLPDPDTYGWENVMYEYHQYTYSDYYNDGGTQISNMQSKIDAIKEAGYNVPSYIGEFNYFSNDDTWDEGISLLNENGLNWTVWSYKCTSDYGNWGLYNQSVDRADLENDDYNTILSKWSSVGQSYINSGIASYVAKYSPGTVDNLTESFTYPEAVGIHQAEDSDYSHSGSTETLKSSDEDYYSVLSGGDGISITGEWASNGYRYITRTVDAETAGEYTLTVAYASEKSVELRYKTGDGEWTLFNESDSVTHVLPASGSWTGVATATAQVTLEEGLNVISISGPIVDESNWSDVYGGSGDNWPSVNLDYFSLSTEDGSQSDSEPVISDDIDITGYQMTATFQGIEGCMGMRVIYQAEDTVEGQTATEVGLIYGLVYDDSVTEDDMVYGSDNIYVASYPATDTGVLSQIMGDSQTAAYYVRTMSCSVTDQETIINTSAYTTTYLVRAYAVLEDGSTVYSSVASFTIYDLADYIYQNQLVNNYSSYNYFYTNILSYVNEDYREREFAWSNIVVKS